MNRNKKGIMPEITRTVYKDVKRYDRQQFTAFCTDLYKYGFEDGRASVPGIDLQEVIRAVSETKGIGEKKMAAKNWNWWLPDGEPEGFYVMRPIISQR